MSEKENVPALLGRVIAHIESNRRSERLDKDRNDDPRYILDTLRDHITQQHKDWSATDTDAYIYGMIAGWGDLTEEVCQLRWGDYSVEHMGRLHDQFNEANEILKAGKTPWMVNAYPVLFGALSVHMKPDDIYTMLESAGVLP